MKYGCLGLGLDLAVSRLFYRSLPAVILLLPLTVLVPRIMRERLREERQQVLARQFRDGAVAVSSALSCGYSIENAFRQATAEMVSVYGEDSCIAGEFRRICACVEINGTVETAVRDLADRSGLAEIEQFAEVFSAAKRSSGDLVTVLGDTADLLSRKIGLREEIRTLVAAKRLEQSIMCMMPAGILLYTNVTNPGYTDPLYQGIGGHIIMTLCLMVYGFAVWWGRRILDIRL